MSPSQPIRVMLVDDHTMVRRGLATFLMVYDDLELAGEAGSGEAALKLCGQVSPDVILMDLMMPDMDGVTATRLIRQQFPEVQVVVLTSFKEEQMVQNALQAGAIGYLLKDVSADELARAIRAAHAGRATLSPEAAQALGPCCQPAARARPRSDGARAGCAGVDGRRVEQYPDRRKAGSQPVHYQNPRQPHPIQVRRRQPLRSRGVGFTQRIGRLTVSTDLRRSDSPPAGGEQTPPGGWMRPGGVCYRISA